jgi:hypothetical protein
MPATAISTAHEPRATIAAVFKYLLMLADGEPVDPAVFVTAVPNWKAGEEFMVSSGDRFRILGINDEIDVEGLEELYRRGIFGIWKVEPVD